MSMPHFQPIAVPERFRPEPDPAYVVERKLTGSARLLPFALAVLDAWCLPDGEYPDGHVRSIYFETIRLDSYAEKANGDHLKTKIRLRWYGESVPDPDGTIPVFFERKNRIGIARDKFRKNGRADKRRLEETPLDDASFLDYVDRLSADAGIPEGFSRRPLLQISYQRRRWVSPLDGSRISLDWKICAERLNPKVFPWAEAAIPLTLPTIVCEFKNAGGVVPMWLPLLEEAGFRYSSFSKYGVFVTHLKEGTQPV